MTHQLYKTRRDALVLGVAGLCGLGLSRGTAEAATTSLTIASSGGKLSEVYRSVIFNPWEKETGIKIQDATTVYAKVKSMVDANAVEWDVIQIDSTVAAVLAKQGLLETIDYSKIDKSKFIKGTTNEKYIVSDVAAAVLSWNTNSVPKGSEPKTWKDVWDLNKIKGKRGFWKRASQTLEIALLADGVEPAKLYPLDLDRAFKSLDKIKSSIYWWTSGAQSAQLFINGEISVGMAWNGRLQDPKAGGAPVDFHFGEALLVGDAWIVPRGVKNKSEAMQFLAYAVSAKQQAEFAKEIPYGPVNTDANALLSPERLKVLPSSQENMAKSAFVNNDWWADNGEATEDRFNKWLLI